MAVTTETYERAVDALKEAIALPKSSVVRDATIQRFEFCVELAWKTAKKLMGSSSTAPKQILREMAQNGYIENIEQWLIAIEMRNLSSHTYNQDLAEKVYEFATQFLKEFEELRKTFLTK